MLKRASIVILNLLLLFRDNLFQDFTVCLQSWVNRLSSMGCHNGLDIRN